MKLIDQHPLSPSARRTLWLVLIITLCLRLGVLLFIHQTNPESLAAQDTGSYVGPAQALLETGNFAQSPAKPDQPELVRTPGYPAFIAAVQYFFGPGLLPVALAQVFISQFALIAAFSIARHLWGPAAAGLCIALLGLDLSGFLFSQQILSECLFTALLSLALLCGVRLILGGKGPGLALGLGLFFGLATLTRPITYYLIPILALFVLIALWRVRLSFMPALGLVLVMLLPLALLVGGWQYRNHQVAGISGLSNIVGENLLKYWAAEVVAMRDGITRLDAENKLLDELGRPREKGLPPNDVMRIYKTKAIQIMVDHPGLVFKGVVRGAVTTLFVPLVPDVMNYLGLKPDSGPLGDFLRMPLGDWATKWLGNRPWELAAHLGALVYLLFVYLGALVSVGLILRGGAQAWAQALVWLVILYIIGIALGPSAYGRLRAPVMPLLCMAAGAGWAWLSGRMRPRSW
jgi:4-amino-4-deoxy-L-arabinose transferase-like glycosyltransferase